MTMFRNYYKCPCGNKWQDDWSATCDDRCPNCGTSCSPSHSIDLDFEEEISSSDDQPSDEETLEECKARLQRISEETKAEIKAGKFKPGYISKKPKDSFTDVDYAKLEARVMAREDPFAMTGKTMRFLEAYSGKTMSGRLTHHEPRMEEIPREMFSFSEYGEALMKEMMDSMYVRHGGRGSGKSSVLDDIYRALASEGEITKMISSMVIRKEPKIIIDGWDDPKRIYDAMRGADDVIIIDSYPSGIAMWGEDMKFPTPPKIWDEMLPNPEASKFTQEEIPPKKRGFAHLNPTPKHPRRGK